MAFNWKQAQCGCAAFFVAAAGIFFVSRVISRVTMTALYRAALAASIVNHGIALKLAVKRLSLTAATLDQVVASPAMPHFMLSLFFWLNNDTFLVQLLPMMVYAIYQVIEYVPTDQKLAKSPPWKRHGKKWAEFLTPRKPMSLAIAAHLEIVTLVLIVASIIRMRGSLVQLLVFTQYLLVQSIQSPAIKAAIASWDRLVLRVVADSRCPVIIRDAEAKIRSLLSQAMEATAGRIRPVAASRH